jgi:hypothetical protein
VSDPYFSTIDAGGTTLPLFLDIFEPSLVIIPCVNRALNGSSASKCPMSRRALTKNRAYSRCRIACSTPPMYWSTGIQWLSTDGSHAAASFLESV